MNLCQGVIGLTQAALKLNQASQEEIKNRRDHCRACAHATRHPRLGLTTLSRCTICGCLIAPKTTLLTHHCPIRKW